MIIVLLFVELLTAVPGKIIRIATYIIIVI